MGLTSTGPLRPAFGNVILNSEKGLETARAVKL